MRTPSALCAALLCSQLAWAQPAARGLDQALVDLLALGRANGCGTSFGIPDFGFDQRALDTYLAGERDAGRLGRELAAICGSSAVASAAALGGSLGSVQATKTVSQFRLARSRADSRLNPGDRRSGLDAPILLAQAGGVGTIDLRGNDERGTAAFVQIDHENRQRSGTALEAGWRARTTEAAVGMDFALPGAWFAGGWIGWRGASADYRAPGLLLGGADAGFGASLDAATRAAICRIGAGGGFDDEGLRLGAFVARRMGSVFVDGGVQFSRRDYRYSRNVCAIEGNSGAVTADAASPSGFASDGIAIDDVYAGTVSGKARLSEAAVSARVGVDFESGAFAWGPRLGLSYTRTTVGAYTESGRTSVTHTVSSNNADVLQTPRAAGDPTGLELAFERRHRSSLQSELQLVASMRHETNVGTLTPRLALSWLHEFRTDRPTLRVRMAQDRRASPVVFAFDTDAPDANHGVATLGLRWERGADLAGDLEIRREFGGELFSATSVGLRLLWRF